MATVKDHHRWVEEVRRVDPNFELRDSYFRFKQISESLRRAREELPEFKHEPNLLKNRLRNIEGNKRELEETGLVGKNQLRRKLKSLYDGRMPRLSEHLEIYFSLNGTDLEILMNQLGYTDTLNIGTLTDRMENRHLINWLPYHSQCNHLVHIREHPYKIATKTMGGNITPYARLSSIADGEMERVYIVGNKAFSERDEAESVASTHRKSILELKVGSMLAPIYPDWVPPSHPERQKGFNPLFDMVGGILDEATERGIQCYYVNGLVDRYGHFVTNLREINRSNA